MFFGAALGNVVRGVPLDASGYFFEPLWTNFQLGDELGILDWYSILVGMLALAALVVHGALWVTLKTTGTVRDRSRRLASQCSWVVLLLTLVVTFLTFRVQPSIAGQFRKASWGAIFPLLAIAGLLGVRWAIARADELKSFFASAIYLAGMLLSVVFGLFPMVLPARNPAYSLTVENSQAASYGLKIGAIWWILGIILATGYFAYVYKSFAGKVIVGKHSDE